MGYDLGTPAGLDAIRDALYAGPYLMYDDFSGPVADMRGRVPIISTIGATWDVDGAAYQIVTAGGGRLTQSSSAASPGYPKIDFGEVPFEIGCTFQYIAGAAPPVISSYASNWATDMAHFYLSSTGYTHTYWKTGVGSGIGAQWGVGDAHTLVDGAEYTYRVFLFPEAAYGISQLEDAAGNVLSTAASYEPNYATLFGRRSFFETFGPDTYITRAWARKRASKTVADAPRLPTDLNAPAATYRARSLHVGPGAPLGRMSVRYDGNTNLRPRILSTGAADFEVKAENSGYESRLLLTNGGGGTAIIRIGGGYEVTFASSQAVFLTKPFNAAPYFAGGIRPNGAASPLITSATAAPTTGTYAAGDRVLNSAPAVGSPKGWICTVAGTPGTWVSEGNL